MNPAMTLSVIYKIIQEMVKSPENEKPHHYATIKILIDELEKIAVDHNIILSDEFSRLLWSCKSIAKLSDGHGHDDSQHQSWAYSKINTIKKNLKDITE